MAKKKKVHDLDLNRDFVNPTGKLIADKMHENDITLVQLAAWTHMPIDNWRAVMFGKRVIMPQIAEMLEHVFGIPAEIWLKKQEQNKKNRG